ncbi:uncharacterized protein LOC124445471 [Xenia sp. Carnegie-2017]|uniref:uncharacterized protein LOC124445471 n=1 Tax=Xenia sp. Carnegie-2017 TaxID=2897299 RepID=UPI001F048D78|nr:uncharacterized protein LOC124445471 [Xenia sp. Carnegie-2017]
MASQLDRLRQNKVSYAKRHNYRYIEDTFGFHRHGNCHRVWNKIHAILKYLPDCKMLMWIDTDAIFVNMEKSLESFMEPYPEIELIFTWYKKESMLNAGIFLVRGSPLVREFFVNVTAGYAWTKNHCIYTRFEQSAINDQLKSGTVDGKYFYERTNAMQNLCGFGNRECLPTKTDFILHLAPPACPALGYLIKKFFDKNPQFF